MDQNVPFFRNLTLATIAVVSWTCLHPLKAIAQQSAPQAAASTDPAAQGATSFINTMASKAVQFLGDKSLSELQKKSQFRTLLFADFDMDTIGRFSLGTYWNSATPAQRQQYLSLFREMIAQVYSQRFEGYNGQKFQVKGSESAGGNDTLVHSSIIPTDGPEIDVDWRVRNKGGQYKVVDVVVAGVSMAVTQRSDFSSVIQRGGGNINVLLDHLRHPDANDVALPSGNKGQSQ